MKRLALILAGVVVLLGTVTAHSAAKVARSGVVHEIDVVQFQNVSATALVHTVQSPDGKQTALEVPDTADLELDVQPALDIDPVTDQPVLVWSRDDGDGFDLYLSRYDGASWSAAERVAATGADDGVPQIQVDLDMIHLVWRATYADGRTDFLRQSLWRTDLGLAFGPEMLDVPGEESGLVPPDGEDDPGPVPRKDEAFFTVEIPPRDGTGARVVIWGIRDEPVPIGYKQGFLLPNDLRGASMSSADWIGDTFAVWFVASQHFRYQLREDSGWSELRTIRLGEKMSAAQAEQALREMLTRPGSSVD